MTTHEVLCKARNVLDREGWVQGPCIDACGVCAYGALGIAVGFWDRDAFQVGGHLESAALERVYAEMADLVDTAPIDFNEANGRTQGEVLALFDKAIAATAPSPADPFPSELPDLTPVI